MPDNIEKNTTDNKPAKSNQNILIRVIRRTAKIGMYAALALLLLLIFFLIFIQTNMFNDLAKDYVVDIMNDQWADRNGVLHVEGIDGNILKGLTLTNGSVTVFEDTLVQFTSAKMEYNIWKLLNKDLQIHHLELYDPQINLTMVRTKNDSLVWNFEHLLMQEEKLEDTTLSVFDWGIFVDDLKIHNGNLRIVKDKGEAKSLRDVPVTKLDTIDFNNIEITNFYLDATAQYLPDYKYINIRNLSSSTNSDFNLKHLTVEAKLDEDNRFVEVKNLNLITSRSDIHAKHLRLDNFNPFSDSVYQELRNAPLIVDMDIKKFYFADLILWLPVLNFFDNWAAVQIKADGSFSDLNVKNVTVNTPNSLMHATGKVLNLDSVEALYFDIRMFDSQISGGETKVLLPGLPIPDYENVGMIDANATYKGTVYKFISDFDFKTGAGSAKGILDMDMRGTPLYKTEVTTNNLDLGKLLLDESLMSSLNMHARITGSGFDPEHTNTKIVYEMQNSKIFEQNIISSAGIVDINGMNFNLDVNVNATTLQGAAKGTLNIANIDNPKYDLTGHVKGLDVSQFTKLPSDKSNLNFSFDVNGSGASLNNLNGDFRLNFANSYYSNFTIPATPVDLKINNSQQNGYVTLTSNIADFNAKGNLNLGMATDVLISNLESIADEIGRRTGSDSSLFASNTPVRRGNINSNVDVDFELNVKNPNALAQFFKNDGIYFDGSFTGSLTNSPTEFNFFTNFNAKKFSYQDSVLNMNNFTGDIRIVNDYKSPVIASSLDQLEASIQIRGKRLVTGNTFYDSVKIDYELDNSLGNLTASTVQGPERRYYVSGITDLTEFRPALKIDTMFVKYDLFDITNDGRMVVRYEPSGSIQNFRLDTFNLLSNYFEVTGQGVFSPNGESDITLEGSKIKVAEVLEFAYPSDTSLYARVQNQQFRSPIRGDIRRLFIAYKGNLENPDLTLELNTELLRYENNRVGRVDAFAYYKDNNLNTDILVSNAQGRGRLRVEGNIPFENPLKSMNDSLTIMQIPMDLKVNAQDFQINFFSRIIPNIGDLRGLLNGNLVAAGTPALPNITGMMQFSNGSFFLPLTGMHNRFSGTINADNTDLVINDFIITSGNDKTAELRLGGKINMEGLTVSDIDISGTGSMYLIDETVENNEFDLYGTLLVSTGDPIFSIKGDLKDINLSGQFLIQDADVELRSIAHSPYNIYDDNFVYTLITDSNFVMKDTVIYVTKDEYDNTDPFIRTKYYVVTEEPAAPTRFNYNINVQTVKRADVSFTISRALRQELFGQIEADLDIRNSGTKEIEIYGDMNIVGDSYLRFYRNFQVKNSRITFNGPATNPNLDIHAVYEASRAYEDKIAVLLDVTGPADNMNVALRLNQNDEILATEDAKSDAVSYILFGVPRGQLTETQRNAVGTIGATTGSSYISSMFSDAIRTIAPFVTSAELSYTEGNLQEGTSLNLTSQFGGAIIRVGGRVFSGLSNTEVTIEYPLNRMFNIDLSNRLLFEFFRLADFNAPVSSGTLTFTTGIKLSYKITF